jgi:hypothetical protein
MNQGRALFTILWLTAGLALVSCGGGGQSASGGSGGTGAVARGSVSQIGSIFVNGVEYDTRGATIHIPGQAPYVDSTGTTGGSDILVGMLVTVHGTIDANGVTGTADTVTYSRALVGQVSALAATASGSTFSIYGQRVVVDNLTKFLPADGAWLLDDQWVEVSGYVLDGEVRATFVKQVAAPTSVEIEGLVVEASAAARTLRVGTGGTLVRLPAAFDLSRVSVGSTFVEVVAVPPAAAATELTATSVTVQDMTLGGEEGEEAEIEGLITYVGAGGTSFVVNGQPVRLAAGTEFQGGAATDLIVGAKVEVEGAINAAGALVAEEIDFKDSIAVSDVVFSVDGVNDRFTYDLGLTVQLDPGLTEGYASVTAGEAWRIRGREVGGVILATSMELVDPADDIELQGPVSAFTATSALTILGVNVTGLNEFAANDGSVSRAQFFSLLQVNDLVEVKGPRVDAATVDWVSADLE